MRALVLDQAGVAVRDLPAPEPVAGEVLIRVHACAVCQSDLHLLRDRQSLLGRFEDGGGLVLGHELSGTIVATGPGVTGFPTGARVTARPLATCGRCVACRRGLLRACPERSVVGFTRPGAFAEFVTVPASAVYHLPDEVSDEAAALAEPLACAYNAVLAANVNPGDWAVVIGPGPLGLLATQVLKRCGAQVLVAGTRPARLEVARQCGADAIALVTRTSPAGQPGTAALDSMVRARTDGLGADATLEMVGSNEALAQALATTRLGGTVVLAGEPQPGAGCTIEPHRFFFQEQRLVASLGAAGSFPQVIRLLASGMINTKPLLTHTFTLEQAPDAFHTVAQRQDDVLKALVRP